MNMTKFYNCIKVLIDDEQEAIDGYIKAKDECTGNTEACLLFDAIIADEQEHISLLEALCNESSESDGDSYTMSDAMSDLDGLN